MAGQSSQGAKIGYAGRELRCRVISGVNQDSNEVDITDLGTTGGFREFLQGFKDPGEVTIESLYDPSLSPHQEAVGGLKHLYNTGGEETFTYTLGDGSSTISFDAYVKSLSGPTAGVDEPHVITYTLRVTGAVTMPS